LIAEDREVGPVRITGSARFAWASGRPLPFDLKARNVSFLDLNARIDWRRWFFDVRLENLAPWEWRSAEFVYPSRWDLDDRASPLPVRHVVAGKPFVARIAVGRWF